MKIAILSLMLLGAAGAGLPVFMQGERADASTAPEQQSAGQSADAGRLYDMVRQARAALRETRVLAGLDAYAPGPQVGRLDGGEGRGGQVGRERGAGGEEGGAYLAKMTRQDEVFANGARLVLQFNPNTQAFVGSVTNTTARTLSQVRVEIHLDNGTELGPTKRIDVEPGRTIPVELGTFGNEFSSWVSHPEAGVERGHGAGGEEGGEGRGEHGARGEGRGEGRGEHGGREGGGEHGGEGGGERGGEADGEGARPSALAYRPLYNQLQLLRGEMYAFRVELKAKSR